MFEHKGVPSTIAKRVAESIVDKSTSMTSRERVYKTLRFEPPDRTPRDLWTLQGVGMFRSAELRSLLDRYPMDIALPIDTNGNGTSVSKLWGGDLEADGDSLFRYGRSDRVRGTAFIKGKNVDDWGVEWEVGEDGVLGEVKQPLLADWSRLDHYTLPWEILNNANWDAVHALCRRTEKFVITPWHINIFERMQMLRGPENLFADIGYGDREFFRLRDILHEFFLREIDLWCATNVDGVRLSDDWGSQQALLIAPTTWRELYKPLYAEYCRRIHKAGKFVFMHSDGNIATIIPDLIEIGVDALNAQLFCMDLEQLACEYRGRITFWGEVDRQWVLPFGGPDDARAAVRRIRTALDKGSGGVIAQLEWGKDDPRENVEACFEAWLER